MNVLLIVLPIVAFLVGLALGCTGTLAAFAPRVAVLERDSAHVATALGKLEASAERLNADLNGVANRVREELERLRDSLTVNLERLRGEIANREG